jgi:hypothetical protein
LNVGEIRSNSSAYFGAKQPDVYWIEGGSKEIGAMEHKVGKRAQRWLVICCLSLLVVLVAAFTFVKANVFGSRVNLPSSISSSTTSSTRPTVGISAPSLYSSPNHPAIYNIESFGADPTGRKDSTVAIRAAIQAAEAKPGSEVYFPPGRFILDRSSPKLFDFVISKPIEVVGAGIHRTTIVNEVGQKTPGVKLSTDMFAINVALGQQTGGGSGSTITNMTLDSASYDAGTDIMDFANHTTLSNLKVLAARSTNTYNYNSFGVRVIAICNPSTVSHIYRVDNVINNVTIVGQGSQGTTELDLSCQVGTTASNINIEGNGVDIFYCHNDTISNASLVGGMNGSTHFYTWVITGSYNIRLSHINANGIGGVIAPDVHIVSHDISITNEIMQNKSSFLYIGDSRDVSISNSSLGAIAILPKYSVSELSLKNTTYLSIKCAHSAAITGLSGLACPSYSHS